MPLVYTLTELGQDTLTTDSVKSNLPQDYRRLLAMIEVGGHIEVLRGRLRRFPDRLIDEWLQELVQLKMIDSHEAGDLDAITFTGARLPLQPPLTDDDRKRPRSTSMCPPTSIMARRRR